MVIDANVSIAICAREVGLLPLAEAALQHYALLGWRFYAPSAIVVEVLYVLCGKLQSGVLPQPEYDKAFLDFIAQVKGMTLDPMSDPPFILRAEQLRQGYGCSHSSDGLYLALAEELARTTTTELLTFDQGLAKQAAKNAPTVKVNLLVP